MRIYRISRSYKVSSKQHVLMTGRTINPSFGSRLHQAWNRPRCACRVSREVQDAGQSRISPMDKAILGPVLSWRGLRCISKAEGCRRAVSWTASSGFIGIFAYIWCWCRRWGSETWYYAYNNTRGTDYTAGYRRGSIGGCDVGKFATENYSGRP